jgi:hypothetical protein
MVPAVPAVAMLFALAEPPENARAPRHRRCNDRPAVAPRPATLKRVSGVETGYRDARGIALGCRPVARTARQMGENESDRAKDRMQLVHCGDGGE